MYRTALRSSSASFVRAARQPVFAGGARRMLTTAPAAKKSTWKGAAVRWGVAIGAVYWYSTSPIFADEAPQPMISEPPAVPEPEIRSVDAVLEEKRRAEAAKAEKLAKESVKKDTDKDAAPASTAEVMANGQSAEELESEAGQQGAYNPETGEINWDCPCLGGMAHGPCGEDFKSAFSCFVHSEVDPKGMDCIDKFQHMQDCFREHPDVYGAELTDDEESEGAAAGDAQSPESGKATVETADAPVSKADAGAGAAAETPEAAKVAAAPAAPSTAAVAGDKTQELEKKAEVAPVAQEKKTKRSSPTKAAKTAKAAAKPESGVPTAAFDATTHED